MSGKSQVKVYLPEELHDLLNAEKRSNSEIVESALWTEFGGHRKSALEKRVEEKEKRMETIQEEIENREEELEEQARELEAFKSKLEDKHSERKKREETLREARDVIREDKRTEDNPAVRTWADKAEMPVSEFLEALDDE